MFLDKVIHHRYYRMPFKRIAGKNAVRYRKTFKSKILLTKRGGQVRNNSDDVILAQITTQPVHGHLKVSINNNDVTVPFKPPHTSMNVYCKKIAVIHKSLIQKSITKLSGEKLKEILERISSMFTID